MNKNRKQYVLKKENKKAGKNKKLRPHNAQSWNILSQIYLKNRLYEKAIEAATKATKLEPENAIHWYSLGVSYHYVKKYDEAIEAIAKEFMHDNDNALYWYSLSAFYYATEKYEKAIEEAIKAKNLESKKALYWNILGKSYYATEKYDKAIEAAIKATNLERKNALYWYSLGVSYHFAEKYEKAIEAKLKATELEPNDAINRHSLAKSYRKKEMYDKANEQSENAVEIIRSENLNNRKNYIIFYHCGWMNYLVTRNINMAEKYFIEGKKYIPDKDKSIAVSDFLSTLIKEIKEDSKIKLVKCFAEVHLEILETTQFYFLKKIIDDLKSEPNIQLKMICIYLSIKRIMNSCAYKNTYETEIYHYSKMDSLSQIIKKNNKDENGNEIKIRLNNASYMNDPSEGRMLIDCLRDCFSDGNTLLKEFCKNYYCDEYIDMQAMFTYLVYHLLLMISQCGFSMVNKGKAIVLL